MTIVKRQHYAWRRYLRVWSTEERIWTYLLEKRKVIPSNLMGVAQQMYFYQLSEISAADGQFLRQFITHSLSPLVRPLVEDFVRLSEEYTKLKQKMAAAPPAAANAADMEQQLRDVEVNSLEHIHGKIENSGERLVACRSLADLQALESSDEDEDDELLTAVFFMCVQYFRTRVRKNAVLRNFPPDWTDRVERYWHILSFGLAAEMAYNIMKNANRQFCFIQNASTLEFITGDQPVINILDERTDEQGNALEMALYYPLAPTCALLLQFVQPAEGATKLARFNAITVDATEVAKYNAAIFQRSEQFVFASSQAVLDNLLSTLTA